MRLHEPHRDRRGIADRCKKYGYPNWAALQSIYLGLMKM
jgi:hypothetical protein